QGIYDALIESTPEFDETLQALYREWLVVCVDTEKLLARAVERGHAAAHADEFRGSAAVAREKVNSMAWVRKSRKFRNEPAVGTGDD
ncbi:MAG TPA: hypothetical protein PK867_31295, partial [Pirellulales bacterium]|nr:hypothetical protein [Pirellulales bacterium]